MYYFETEFPSVIFFVIAGAGAYDVDLRSPFLHLIVFFFFTFSFLLPHLCFAILHSTIEELTAEQTEYLVWEHASKLREIFEGKV